MIYKAPLYTKDFSCIADKCRDSCCIGWEIPVDEKTQKKYKKMRGALGEAIRESLSEDGCFRLCENGRCPHLDERGLCRIILAEGEGALCSICHEHPRFFNLLSDKECEWGIGLACESAARLILSADDPLSEVSHREKARDAKVEADEGLLPLLKRTRKAIGALILDADLPMEKKFLTIERMAESLQKFMDFFDISKEEFTFCDASDENKSFLTEERFEKYKALLLSLEPLNKGWRKRCEGLCAPAFSEEGKEFFERLLYYFIYRYMITAAEDGDAQGKIGFALFSTVMICALCEREGRKTLEEIAEAAKDFSKEVEYSEDNRDAVLDAFSAFA